VVRKELEEEKNVQTNDITILRDGEARVRYATDLGISSDSASSRCKSAIMPVYKCFTFAVDADL
jgi:calcineurin-like phosphoesterase